MRNSYGYIRTPISDSINMAAGTNHSWRRQGGMAILSKGHIG